MEELVRSDDPVFLSWLLARLESEGIAVELFDRHVGGLFPGALSALACKVMVAADDLARARRVLAEAPDGER